MKLIKTRKIDAVTCSLVLSEIEWVLRSTYNASKEEIIDQLEYIDNLPIISINTYWDQTAIDIYRNHKVKLVDAQITSIPQIKKSEWTIVSYDRDFDKLKVRRKEPAEIIRKKY